MTGDSLTALPSRVLYVEDDEGNIHLVQRILKLRPEIQLIVARTGRDAVIAARREIPDLILLDRHLPDLPGDDVLAELNSTPETAAIPVVMVSGDPVERVTMAPGTVGSLGKPYDIRSLLAIVDEHAGDGHRI